jgi:hypothetical protein
MEPNYVMAREKKPFDINEYLKLPNQEAKNEYAKGRVQGPAKGQDPKRPAVTHTKPITVEGEVKKAPPVVPEAVPAKIPEVQIAREHLAPQEEMQRPFVPEPTAPAAPAAPQESGMGLSDWLVGATPLLVDFLMGNNGGTDIAANYFIKKGTPADPKLNNDLQIQRLKLAAEQAKTNRAMAGQDGKVLNKNQGAWTKGPDGKPLWKTWNEINRDGLELSEGGGGGEIKNSVMDLYEDENGAVVKLPNFQALQRGLKPANKGQVETYLQTVRPDKEADRGVKVSEGEANRASREKLAMMRLKDAHNKLGTSNQRKAFEKFASATSPYGKAEEKVYGAINAMDMLNKGGVIGANGLPTVIAKQIFGEVGNLSSTDLSMARGNQNAPSLAQRLYQKLTIGELGPEDRKDVETVIKAAYDHASWKARRIAEKTKSGHKALGVDIAPGVDAYVDIPPFPALQSGIPSAHNRPSSSAPMKNRAETSILTPPESGKVKVIAPDGTPGTIPSENLEKALGRGYRKAE